ncbi:unnamed protein product [Caenorhabditis nigoni]|nr:hypothetical protein B9Z55_025120 [Caenorhabditis nigoni]
MGHEYQKHEPKSTKADEVAEKVEKYEEAQEEEKESVQEDMKPRESDESDAEEMEETQETLVKEEERQEKCDHQPQRKSKRVEERQKKRLEESNQEEDEPVVKKSKKTSKKTGTSSQNMLELEPFSTLLPRLKHEPEHDINDEDFKKMFSTLCTEAEKIDETGAKHEEGQMEESEYARKVTKRCKSDKSVAREMKKSQEPPAKKVEKPEKRDQQMKRTSKRLEGKEQRRWEESDQEEWEEPEPVVKKSKKKCNGKVASSRKLPSASELPQKLDSLGALLPSLKHDPNNVISDDDFKKLFHALCPDTDKLYDSDDSIISEIDGLSAAELANGTARCQEAMEYIRALPDKIKAVNVILNQGNETKKEREDRRKAIREIKQGLKTKDEKARAQRIIQRENKKLEKSFATVVHVFDKDEYKTLCSDSELPLVTPRHLAQLLSTMAEIAPDVRMSKVDNVKIDFEEEIKEINETDLEKKLKEGFYRGDFFTDGNTKAHYLKTRIAKIFEDKEVLEVLGTDRYGFEFSTKEAILVLANYYTPNRLKQDNPSLEIKIKELAAAAYFAFRSSGREMPKINEPLRMALGF